MEIGANANVRLTQIVVPERVTSLAGVPVFNRVSATPTVSGARARQGGVPVDGPTSGVAVHFQTSVFGKLEKEKKEMSVLGVGVVMVVRV